MIDKSATSVTNLFMVLAVVVMAALAYSVSQDSADSERQLLVPELAEQLNDLQSVRITGAGDTVIAGLQKATTDSNESNWVVVNAGNYPADVGALRSLLLTLAEADIIEEKTANPDYYDRLGVTDIASPDAGGVRIDIQAPEQTIGLIIGDTRINGDNTYVRRADESASWLVSGVLEPGKQTSAWLNRSIVKLTADRISKVTISHPNDETLVISKESVETPAFTLENMPEKRVLSYEGILNTVAGAAANLQLDEVVSAADTDLADAETVTARFETFDGLVLDINIHTNAEQTWLSVNASATGTEAEAEAQAINARTKGWLYEVADYKISPMRNRMEDMLKKNG